MILQTSVICVIQQQHNSTMVGGAVPMLHTVMLKQEITCAGDLGLG
jgi:hypothetical protein